MALLLGEIQGAIPPFGLSYHGRDCRLSKVHFSPELKLAKKIVKELMQFQLREVHPRLVLNGHCSTCEFSAQCREQVLREDNISLFGGLGQKSIAAYARKGIFTITQLSHTFRPQRTRKRSPRS
jgi:predicted RecB family nuclease